MEKSKHFNFACNIKRLRKYSDKIHKLLKLISYFYNHFFMARINFGIEYSVIQYNTSVLCHSAV